MANKSKGLGFSLLTLLSIATYSLSFLYSSRRLQLGVSTFLLGVLLVVLALLFFRDSLFSRRSQDKRLKFRLDHIRQTLFETMASTLELRSLLFSIITIITNNLKLTGASIYLYNKDTHNFALKESFKLKKKSEHTTFDWQHPLYISLVGQRNILCNEEAFQPEATAKRQASEIATLMNEQQAAYCLPIFAENELIAIIFLGTKIGTERLNGIELDFLRNLIPLLGTPIHNASAHYETQRQVDELSSLYEVGKVINSSFDLNKTIALIASNASILLKSPKVMISLRNDLQKPFELKKLIGFNDEQTAYLNANREITDILTQKMAQNKVPQLIENVNHSDSFTHEYIKILELRSILAVPLFDNDLNVIGELRLIRPNSYPSFSQRDLQMGAHLAGNVAIALRNAKLYSELSTVYNLDQSINALFDFNKIQERIISILEKEFGFKRILIFVYDKKNSKLIPSLGKGWEKKIYQELDINIYNNIMGRSIVENRMITIENAPKDPRVSAQITSFLNLHSFISIPLITPGKSVGSILADFDQEPFSQHQLNLSLLQNTANISSMALANCLLYYESEKLNESLTREQSKTNKELQIARYIQQGLLSTKLPENQQITISTTNIPCRSIGGDFFNIIKYTPAKMGLVIGDVSGKGIPAALLMTLASGIFSEVGSYSTSPQQVLIKANHSLREYLKEIPLFYVTAFYGVFDLEHHLFTYSKAGHNPPLYLNYQDKTIHYLDTEGSYLGTFEDCGFMEKTIRLHTGDKLIFYTDGITEARNPHKELFGRARLGQLLQKYADLPPEQLQNKILDEIHKFTSHAEQNDDLILVICQINSTNMSAQSEPVDHCFFDIPSAASYTKQTVGAILNAATPYIKNKQHRFHLRLAVTEAILNAIEHGNKNDINKIVHIEYALRDTGIEVKVRDQGNGFDPEKIVIPENTEESKGRGRGLLAVRACMDEIRYNPQGTELTLIKYFT